MLAVKYPNVYLDTAILYSGTPKDAYHHVMAEQLGLDVMERSLYQKVLFGSNTRGSTSAAACAACVPSV